jgi:transposase InsO family protein
VTRWTGVRASTTDTDTRRSIDHEPALSTRPFRPQTNGKAEAFNKILQAEWAYARLDHSNEGRLAAPLPFLIEYNLQPPRYGIGGAVPVPLL